MKNTKTIMTLVLKVYLVGCVFFKFIAIIWGNPFPWEVREGVGLKIGEYFSEGINPYIFTNVEDLPYANYMYGFIIPFVFSLLRCLFSSNYIIACEIFSLIIEIFGIIFAYKCLKLMNVSNYIAVIASLGVYCAYWRYNGFGGAFPDTFGVTLSIFLCYLILRDEKKNKFTPVLYAFILIIEFYIKQYFLIIALGVFFYLLCKNSKAAITFFVTGCLAGGGSLILVRYFMPTFFTGTVLLLNLSNSYSIWRAFKQFIYLAQYFGLVYLVFLFYVCNILIKVKKEKCNCFVGSFKYIVDKKFAYVFIQSIVMGGFLLYFGQSDGTFYTYYLQLWIPYLVMSTAGMINELKSMLCANDRLAKYLNSSIIPVLGAIVVMMSFGKFTIVTPMSLEQKNEWKYVYNLLDSYSPDSIRIKDNSFVFYCLERGIYNDAWGHDSIFTEETLDKLKNLNISDLFFPYAEELTKQFLVYQSTADKKMIDGEFKCVLLTANEAENKKELLTKYHEIYSTSLWVGGESTNIVIFERN